jgi:hypothetical protein
MDLVNYGLNDYIMASNIVDMQAPGSLSSYEPIKFEKQKDIKNFIPIPQNISLFPVLTNNIHYFDSKNRFKSTYMNLFNPSIVHLNDNIYLLSFRNYYNICMDDKTSFDDIKPWHKGHPWFSYWKDISKQDCDKNLNQYKKEGVIGGESRSTPEKTNTYFCLINISGDSITVVKEFKTYLNKYEDVRLYKDLNNQIYGYGLKYIEKGGRLFRFKINITGDDIIFDDFQMMCKQQGKVEKNWMFDKDNNIYNIPYGSFVPISVYKSIDNNVSNCIDLESVNSINDFFNFYNRLYANKNLIRFSGGTPLITLPDGKKIFVGHVVVDYKDPAFFDNKTDIRIKENLSLFEKHPRDKPFKNEMYKYHHYNFIYYNIFVIIENNKITKISLPFSIYFQENTGINFPTGLTLNNNNELIFTFGESDYISIISIIKLDDLFTVMVPLEYFKENPSEFKFLEIRKELSGGNYYEKYLKYKTKYLNLKNKLD